MLIQKEALCQSKKELWPIQETQVLFDAGCAVSLNDFRGSRSPTRKYFGSTAPFFRPQAPASLFEMLAQSLQTLIAHLVQW